MSGQARCQADAVAVLMIGGLRWWEAQVLVAERHAIVALRIEKGAAGPFGSLAAS